MDLNTSSLTGKLKSDKKDDKGFVDSLNILATSVEDINQRLQAKESLFNETLEASKQINASVVGLTEEVKRVQKETVKQFQTAVDKVAAQEKRIAESIDRLEASLKVFESSITGLAPQINEQVEAAVESPISDLEESTKSAEETMANLNDTVKKLGEAIDRSQINAVVGQFEKLTAAVNNFNDNVAKLVETQRSEITRQVYTEIYQSMAKDAKVHSYITAILSAVIAFGVLMVLVMLGVFA
ncbi:MAG: hypothetical protein JXB14_02785 [Candidatus Altiarchaeota archaeon]|nr:hypothetical protein [Candidatus Altiarchaeota archaeon]